MTRLFAAVRFLVGPAQRFKIRHIRVATITLAFAPGSPGLRRSLLLVPDPGRVSTMGIEA